MQRHLRSRFMPSAHARPGFWRRLSAVARDRLQSELGAALAPYRNRASAWQLGLLVIEQHGIKGFPETLFPLDRRALAGLDSLNLTESQCRGAIATLLKTGLIEREPDPPGSAYRLKGDELHRKPVMFRIGAAFASLVAAIARGLAWLKAKVDRLKFPKEPIFDRIKDLDPGQLRAPLAAASGATVPPTPPIDPASPLAAALARLGRAIGIDALAGAGPCNARPRSVT